MYRPLFLILVFVFLRLLTLTEAGAYVHSPSEANRFLGTTEFDHPANAAPVAYVQGTSGTHYGDYSARAAKESNRSRLSPELANELPLERSDPLSKDHPGFSAGTSLSATLQAAHTEALEPHGILPPRLEHPPYYATAPPSRR